MHKNILYYLFISFLLVFIILFFLNHIENYIEIVNYVNKYFSNI